MNRFFLTAYCAQERTAGISELERIAGKHGFLIDFKIFSDISISMIVEMEERKVGDFYAELKEIASTLDFDPPAPSLRECLVFLNVTFSRGAGNLRTDVPEVPG